MFGRNLFYLHDSSCTTKQNVAYSFHRDQFVYKSFHLTINFLIAA